MQPLLRDSQTAQSITARSIQGNRQPEMDAQRHASAAAHGLRRDRPRSAGVAVGRVRGICGSGALRRSPKSEPGSARTEAMAKNGGKNGEDFSPPRTGRATLLRSRGQIGAPTFLSASDGSTPTIDSSPLLPPAPCLYVLPQSEGAPARRVCCFNCHPGIRASLRGVAAQVQIRTQNSDGNFPVEIR